MYDHHAHVMWQQNDRRLAAASERRRSNLEAVERSRVAAEPHQASAELADAATAPIPASPQLVTSAAR